MGHKESKAIGLVYLHPNSNPESTNPYPHYNRQLCRQLFKRQHWNLSNGKAKKYNIESILLEIKSAKITYLNLSANNISNLPKIISYVHFPSLLRLILCGNNISSIQPLTYLRAQLLIQLALTWNTITSSKPLRKCYFPNLRLLNLQQNNLLHLGQDLSQSCFKELRQLTLQTSTKSLVVCDNIEIWCMKWQAKRLYEIVLSSGRRIWKVKKSSLLKEKYSYLKLIRTGKVER